MGEPTFAERYAAFARFNPDHVKRRLDTLAHNLAAAAFGCWTFEAGRDYQHCIENALSRHDERLAARRVAPRLRSPRAGMEGQVTTHIEWLKVDSDGEMRVIYTTAWSGVGAELEDEQVFRVIQALREPPAPAPHVSRWRRALQWFAFWRKS